MKIHSMNQMTVMNLILGVDAGTLSIMTEEFVNKYGRKPDGSRGLWLRVSRGEIVRISFERDDFVEIALPIEKDGLVYIGDPCYPIVEWDAVLKDTSYLEKDILSRDGAAVFADTEGDGDFLVMASVEGPIQFDKQTSKNEFGFLRLVPKNETQN